MRVNYVIMLIGIVLLGCNTNTVNYQPKSRNITVVIDSAKIYADITLIPYKEELKNNLQYHWYSLDKLGANYGGFNGYLLNGGFKKVNFNGNLLEQGTFLNGLKNGIWKYWYTNGNLLRVEKWKKGVLDNNVIEYDRNGVLITPINSSEDQTKIDSTVHKHWYKKLFKKNK